MSTISEKLVTEFSSVESPEELLGQLIKRFGERAAIGTSGQLTGVAMIDLAIKAGVTPRVFTIDTLKLFPETYTYFETLESHYNIKIERIQPDPEKVQGMVKQHGEYLFFDSKAKQEFCCHVRKVEPNERVLNSVDVWFSGLRKDQSGFRKETPRLEIIHHGRDERPILKVAPMVDWTEADIRKYITDNNVPTHPLLEWEQDGWRYESLGCTICTTPMGPHEARRAGRWRWFNGQGDGDNKECGLHVSPKDKA